MPSVYFIFFNRTAWGRRAVLVLHGFFLTARPGGTRGSSFTRSFFKTARPGADAQF